MKGQEKNIISKKKNRDNRSHQNPELAITEEQKKKITRERLNIHRYIEIYIYIYQYSYISIWLTCYYSGT